MIVQIPVENAIKHGLAGKDGVKELGAEYEPLSVDVNLSNT